MRELSEKHCDIVQLALLFFLVATLFFNVDLSTMGPTVRLAVGSLGFGMRY